MTYLNRIATCVKIAILSWRSGWDSLALFRFAKQLWYGPVFELVHARPRRGLADSGSNPLERRRSHEKKYHTVTVWHSLSMGYEKDGFAFLIHPFSFYTPYRDCHYAIQKPNPKRQNEKISYLHVFSTIQPLRLFQGGELLPCRLQNPLQKL